MPSLLFHKGSEPEICTSLPWHVIVTNDTEQQRSLPNGRLTQMQPSARPFPREPQYECSQKPQESVLALQSFGKGIGEKQATSVRNVYQDNKQQREVKDEIDRSCQSWGNRSSCSGVCFMRLFWQFLTHCFRIRILALVIRQ